MVSPREEADASVGVGKRLGVGSARCEWTHHSRHGMAMPSECQPQRTSNNSMAIKRPEPQRWRHGSGEDSRVTGGSHFALAHLGCGQGFQEVFHAPQATDIMNDCEQLVAAVEAAN
jgi:hypothetical protein